MFKVVAAFTSIVFALIICWYLFISIISVKIIKEIDSNGIKGVVERVWNGTSENTNNKIDTLIVR